MDIENIIEYIQTLENNNSKVVITIYPFTKIDSGEPFGIRCYGKYAISQKMFSDIKHSLSKNKECTTTSYKLYRYRNMFMKLFDKDGMVTMQRIDQLDSHMTNSSIVLSNIITELDKDSFPIINKYHDEYQTEHHIFDFQLAIVNVLSHGETFEIFIEINQQKSKNKQLIEMLTYINNILMLGNEQQ